MPLNTEKTTLNELVLVKTRISESDYQKLKAIAKLKKKTMASIFRTAISEFIEKHNKIQ